MGRAIAYGALAVGVLDILDALVFASGVLGRAAYEGGLATAALGLVFHFFIAFSIVSTYVLAVDAGRSWRDVRSCMGLCTGSSSLRS